ncbi:MAG: sugar phosphate isomerase/epimerase [Armatimonadetes bacterium]|nr:sugar phosphate isomerase/epimerase [Armatimonadota bacterium]
MANPRIGLQLIVYGQRTQEDLAGVLKEVAEVGYAGFEAGNLFASHGEAQARDAIAASGLVVTGMHSGYGDQTDLAKVDANIAYLQAVGAKYYINSGVAQAEGIKAYEEAAETFNAVGARCKEAGLVFCYHNHAWEFEAFDGVKGIHRLAELTDPELVKLCVDVYWVTIGGEDPKEFIERYADRAVYFHFKDGAPGEFIELGQGQVDLVSAREAALACNPEWVVVEQDRTAKEPKTSIAESLAYMKQIGF